MSGTAPSDLSTWWYNNAPSWLGGNFGAPQEGPTQSGATLDTTPGMGAASSPSLAEALQAAGKAKVFNPTEPAALAAAPITNPKPGAPEHALSLAALVQALQKQRAQYGGLSGQPVAQSQIAGLLGF